jgi:triacylglycerol esterase/lipase EstA (alpha/beta hydrolase family)
VTYFRAVAETLEREFDRAKRPVRIMGVRTLPTGSLRLRALRVLDAIQQNESLATADAIHLVGHSTGGIDARIVASENQIGDPALRERLRAKLRTVVCISSPHYGTPLANFFTTLYGKKLLYFITLLVFVGLWRRPIAFAGGVMGLGYKFYDLLGLNESLLRQITNQLLRDFTPAREREVREFLDSILNDVSLMMQLTPESMDMLNAALRPLPEVRHVSYATVAPSPVKSIQRSRLRDLITPLSTVLYTTVYTLTASTERGYTYHPPIAAKEAVTGEPLPFDLDPSANDGVVPALSQIHGEFRGFVRADHLDVVGHYLRGPREKQDGADWFKSGARFDAERFERLWRDVAGVLMGS